MTASTEMDSRLEWLENLGLDATMLTQTKEDELRSINYQNGNSSQVEIPSIFSSTSLHRRLTPQKDHSFAFQMPLDWTPDMRTSAISATWMANHSTPTRSSSSKNRQPLSVLLGQSEAQSPTRNSSILGQEYHIPPLGSNRGTTNHPPSSKTSSAKIKKATLTQTDSVQISRDKREKTESAMKAFRMPPPPLPRHVHKKEGIPDIVEHQKLVNNSVLESNCSNVDKIKDHTSLPPNLSCNGNQILRSNTLPPQYRALYNASTVGPARYARDILLAKPMRTPPISKVLSQKVLVKKDIIRSIANNLSERDAFSFALSCSTVYRGLDVAWWKTKFPVQEEEQAKKSAWVYLWPKSDGWCSFCSRWQRIVMHEPSKAHVCLDCMQLPHFKVIRFSAARMKFKLDNPIAISLFSQLPSVQDNEARYFWICHLEWVEAHCRITEASDDILSSKAMTLAGAQGQKNGEKEKVRQTMDKKGETVFNKKRLKQKSADRISDDHLKGAPDTLEKVNHDPNTNLDQSSELSVYSGYEDAEGDTDEEYDPDTTVEENGPFILSKKKDHSAVETVNKTTNNKRRSRTLTGTSTTTKRRRKDPLRRAKSSPSPMDTLEGQSDGEVEDVESRQHRIADIMREVRRDYLNREIKELGASLSNSNEIPEMFVNGQWEEMQGYGIQQNDFKAMAKWMEKEGMLNKIVEKTPVEEN